MQEIVGQANGTPLTVGKGSKMLTIQYLRIIKILQNRRISVYTNQKLKIICQFDYFFISFNWHHSKQNSTTTKMQVKLVMSRKKKE